uniref:Coiled-coil and C2 domain-containing protein 1B n=1 Tax=Denticeps clupeoides TaxID=299321 RepID=A0AAY3ZW45_9TELE
MWCWFPLNRVIPTVQMGLLLDLDPDGGLDSAGNEEELEAELLALIGGGGEKRSPANKAGRAALPMEDIERMAALCMKDLDEEDGGDEGLEDDADLLAELDEVLAGDGEGRVHRALPVAPHITSSSPAGAGGLESRLLERVDMYQTAISNATAAGESSKARRYDRGLKTLQSMLSTVRKGKPINEEDIPPPVAVGGAKQAPAPQAQPIREQEEPPAYTPTADETPSKPQLPPAPQRNRVLTPDTPVISPVTPVQANLEILVTTRQRQYKQAAVRAKKSGETDLAVQHLLVVKKLGSVVEALDRGEPVDVGALPPPPGQWGALPPAGFPCSSPGDPVVSRAGPQPAPAPSCCLYLPAPRSLEEALQQRMDKYRAVAEGSKTKGDDRKFRMHQRIVKQYQDAIRAHKAGRPVNLAELPVPPGCPPLQGSESGEQNFAGILDTAMKLANQDADAEEDSPDEDAAKVPQAHNSTGQNMAQQQLDFLEKRRQQFVKAALRSKQMKDMQGAAQHLRNAKGLDTMITAAKGGLPVDISKVPSAPVSEEDYSLSRSRASPLSPRASEQYSQLMDLLKKQHEVRYAPTTSGIPQFHALNVGIILNRQFEKLAEECMKDIELLKKAHAKGCATPKYHTEERTFNTVRMNSNLTANDLQLIIVKGVNLPAPAGCSPGDLDASVRFEFPFPSAEEAQRDKTSTVKNTNCPEFKEQFKLSINRTHRSFKRVVQSKGIKFEVIHKGGLFKTDKVVGTAQLKLEALDNQCEIRDIIDVLDGRRPTGGKLEVRVKVREPLCGVQLQPVTEKWLVLDPVGLSPPGRERGGVNGRCGERERESVCGEINSEH